MTTVTRSVSEGLHPASLPLDALLADCDVRRTRRGGPGGQHRNKVETAVVVTHRPTGISGQASERRSQDLNRQAAVARLRIALALEFRRPLNDDQPPSPRWQARAKGRQLAVSPAHEDFAALLAEALDTLAACDWDVGVAAKRLNVTASQLVKLLQREPPALGQLNDQRRLRQLVPLK